MPKKTTTKITDVAPTDTTPADETSIPVIVHNRTVIKDPTLQPDKPAEEAAPEAEEKLPSKPIILMPPSQSKDTPAEPEKTAEPVVKEASQPAAEATEKPELSEAPANPAPASKDESTEGDAPSTPPADEKADKEAADTPKPSEGLDLTTTDEAEAASDETDSATATTDPGQSEEVAENKADKAAIEKQQAMDALVTSEKYFLPINAVEKRRVRQIVFVSMLLLVVLAVAVVAWAGSTGMINVPFLSK